MAARSQRLVSRISLPCTSRSMIRRERRVGVGQRHQLDRHAEGAVVHEREQVGERGRLLVGPEHEARVAEHRDALAVQPAPRQGDVVAGADAVEDQTPAGLHRLDRRSGERAAEAVEHQRRRELDRRRDKRVGVGHDHTARAEGRDGVDLRAARGLRPDRCAGRRGKLHRQRADPAAGPEHQHPVARRTSAEGVRAVPRRHPGDAEPGGDGRISAGGQRHHGVARRGDLGGEQPVAGEAEATAAHQHRLAVEHPGGLGAGDPRQHRGGGARSTTGDPDVERVDRGVGDVDHHLARGRRRIGQVGDPQASADLAKDCCAHRGNLLPRPRRRRRRRVTWHKRSTRRAAGSCCAPALYGVGAPRPVGTTRRRSEQTDEAAVHEEQAAEQDEPVDHAVAVLLDVGPDPVEPLSGRPR